MFWYMFFKKISDIGDHKEFDVGILTFCDYTCTVLYTAQCFLKGTA
jgi:hypothetical protein